MIDVLVSETQFVDHTAPIWLALPSDVRGSFYAHRAIRGKPADWGITPSDGDPSRPVLVASYGDQKRARRLGYRKIARIEHGAGQSYGADSRFGPNPSYAGGRDCHDVSLFLCPNDYSANRWQAAYPGADVEIVGCPKLDTLPAKEPGPLTVAVSWHFDINLIPETRSAFPAYRPYLADLAKRYNVIGHGHPKGLGTIYRYLLRAGIEVVTDFAEVCRRADLYAVDNSCVTPDTPVLCADLRWRPAGELGPGDALIGCDEEATRTGRLRNGAEVAREDRRFRTTMVVANERKVMPCVEVETDRGTMVVSDRHPYLVRRAVPHQYTWRGWTYRRSHEQWQWVEARDIGVGDEVAFLIEPWSDAEDRDAGWLAGMFDGEGNLNFTKSQRPGSQARRLAISVSQNRGPVLDEIYRLLDERGIPSTSKSVRGSARGKNCRVVTLGGRLFDRLRFIGSTRPMRLLSKAIRDEAWAHANVSANVSRARVLNVIPVDEREVCVVQTTSRTLIAGGFMAHNSTLFEFASTGRPVVVLNDPGFRKDVHHGGRFWNWADVGPQVDIPATIGDVIERAFSEDWTARREAVLAEVYPVRSGAARLAAEALMEWAGVGQAVAA